MGKRVDIHGISAEPGEKVSAHVPVSERSDGTQLGFPLRIINGEAVGPRFWLMAGVHGNEVGGIETAVRVAHDFTPRDVNGTLIVVPLANTTAAEVGSRVSPIDGKDLNRSFPGNANGTFTDRLADRLFTAVTSTLSASDFLLDLHGAGSATYVEYTDGNDLGARNLELARASGVRIVDRIVPEFGEGGVSWTKIYAGTLGDALQAKGFKIPHITIESEDPRTYVLNVLKHVGITKGKPTPPDERSYVEGTRVFATKRGLWVPIAREGKRVRKNELLATVLNFDGEAIEEVRSPFNGILIIMSRKKIVDPQSPNLGMRYGANVGKIVGQPTKKGRKSR